MFIIHHRKKLLIKFIHCYIARLYIVVKIKYLLKINGVVSMGFKQINFRIDDKLADELRTFAFERKTSQTALICKYIEEGLNKDKNQTNLDEI
ncbi:hypothetical protein METSMIALI_00351 [Methanobrevibacter smithii DSM 2375]|uniref:Uncharacterized protein n=2 Tax=Methanobrevibacter smithii TaxID=2173 RepID=B9ADC8_METSM|nr:hypothetical protein METSMIALI_00351 [Methanobrevibacter smithii DSM 2375]